MHHQVFRVDAAYGKKKFHVQIEIKLCPKLYSMLCPNTMIPFPVHYLIRQFAFNSTRKPIRESCRQKLLQLEDSGREHRPMFEQRLLSLVPLYASVSAFI